MIKHKISELLSGTAIERETANWLSRRAFALAVIAAVAGAPSLASARGPHGGMQAPPLPPVQLATLTIVNTSGSTVAANFIPQSFGHPFKKGDIPHGSYPQLKLAGGTVVPTTIYGQVYWNDRSLKWCGFIARVPTTVAGSGTLAIQVWSGGSAPSASSRTLADFSAGGLNLQCQFDGNVGLTGTWTSFLNNGISNTNQSNSAGGPDALVYADGPAGKIWRVRASAEQSGAAHGQLEVYWYLYALQDSAGGLYGIRFLPQACQPWIDSSSPTAPAFLAFNALRLQNGATVLLDPTDGVTGSTVSQTFVWGGGTLLTAATSIPGNTGLCVQFSTTGTLPAGLVVGEPFFIGDVTAPSSFTVASVLGASAVNVTDAGTGTHTVTTLPYLTTMVAEYFRPTNSHYNYIQGAGSVAAEATVRVQFDKTYWHTTRLIPPWDLSVTPVPSSTYIGYWNSFQPYPLQIGGTGENFVIGVATNYAAIHFLAQNAVDEQNVRQCGMLAGMFPMWGRNVSTKSLPTANGATYAGLVNEGINYEPPLNSYAIDNVFTGADNSHMPNGSWYAWVITGEPHCLDTIVAAGAWAVSQMYPVVGDAEIDSMKNTYGQQRNITFMNNSKNYYGTQVNAQTRGRAWGPRDVGAAHCFCGASPENASYPAYFKDIHNIHYDFFVDFNAANTSFFQTSGMTLGIQGTGVETYQVGYMTMAYAWDYAINEYPNTLNELNHLCRSWDYIVSTFGGWHTAAFTAILKVTSDVEGPVISNDNQVNFNSVALSWSNGGHFTMIDVTQAPEYLLQNGNTFHFPPTGAPAGFLDDLTAYYVVNASGTGVGSTFDLSLTHGGSPVAVTDTVSNASIPLIWVGAPSTGCIQGNAGSDGFLVNVWGGVTWAYALGATINLSTVNDQLNRVTAYGITFNVEPKYCFQSTF